MRLYLLVAVAACGASQHARRPTEGSIVGLARDHDTGDPVAMADIRLRAQGEMKAHVVTTDKDGAYHYDHLKPGTYSVSAEFAGQPVDISNIGVKAGDTAVVDVVFTLGRPEPIHDDFGNPKDGAIDHYRPRNLSPSRAVIEGTINDLGTRDRVVGAVIYAVDQQGNALQTISNEQGRYRIDTYPGTYAVSAYYSVDGHGQIEVRRMGIDVKGAEAVIVPLWVEVGP